MFYNNTYNRDLKDQKVWFFFRDSGLTNYDTLVATVLSSNRREEKTFVEAIAPDGITKVFGFIEGLTLSVNTRLNVTPISQSKTTGYFYFFPESVDYNSSLMVA